MSGMLSENVDINLVKEALKNITTGGDHEKTVTDRLEALRSCLQQISADLETAKAKHYAGPTPADRREQLDALSPEADTAPIIAAMRHIHGVSDKVLSLALVVLLLGGRPNSDIWRLAGTRLVVIDTLVHNWLHRTGIFDSLDARHPYGAKCYEPNGCADIIQKAAAESWFGLFEQPVGVS